MKSSLKSLLIAVGMSVCISGLLASSTECMIHGLRYALRSITGGDRREEMINRENNEIRRQMEEQNRMAPNQYSLDVKKFADQVKAGSVTPADEKVEKVIMKEMDDRLKNNSPYKEFAIHFEDFIRYKIEQGSLNEEIEKWILDNTKRILSKTEKLTKAEESIVGSYHYKGIFYTFMEAKINAKSFTAKNEKDLFERVKIICEKTTELTEAEERIVGSKLGASMFSSDKAIFKTFIEARIEANKCLAPEIEKWILDNTKRILSKTEKLTTGEEKIAGGYGFGIFETFMKAKINANKYLDKKIEEWLFEATKRICSKTEKLTDGEKRIIGAYEGIGIFQNFISAKMNANSLDQKIEKWILDNTKRILSKTDKLTDGEKGIVGGLSEKPDGTLFNTGFLNFKYITVFYTFICHKIDQKSLTEENEEMFCEMILNATEQSMVYEDVRCAVSNFVKERLNSNVKDYDHDGNRKIFLEHAEKVVKRMNERKALEEQKRILDLEAKNKKMENEKNQLEAKNKDLEQRLAQMEKLMQQQKNPPQQKNDKKEEGWDSISQSSVSILK